MEDPAVAHQQREDCWEQEAVAMTQIIPRDKEGIADHQAGEEVDGLMIMEEEIMEEKKRDNPRQDQYHLQPHG